MERFTELLESSKKKLESAEHATMEAFPIMKDPKLLMNSVDNCFLSMTYAMGALLHLEMTNGRINQFEDKFEQKIEIFEKECMPRYGIKQEYTDVMKKLKEIIIAHHQSAMVFSKNDQLMICGEDYTIRKLGYEETKRYLFHTGSFYNAIQQILSSQTAKKDTADEKKKQNILDKLFNRKV